MKLRDVLNELSAKGYDDDQLLDMDVKITIPDASGQLKVKTTAKDVTVIEEKEFSRAEGRIVVKERYIGITTGYVHNV